MKLLWHAWACLHLLEILNVILLSTISVRTSFWHASCKCSSKKGKMWKFSDILEGSANLATKLFVIKPENCNVPHQAWRPSNAFRALLFEITKPSNSLFSVNAQTSDDNCQKSSRRKSTRINTLVGLWMTLTSYGYGQKKCLVFAEATLCPVQLGLFR